MGSDPEASVLDRDCRAHEVDNLYVLDTSVFDLLERMGAKAEVTLASA
jgi:choline dehydrogenase-like flavoprotein